MSSAAGGAPASLRPAELPHDSAETIRDTVDGGPIPNLKWVVVESLTHAWTTKRLGEGGFGEVFKGTGCCFSLSCPSLSCPSHVAEVPI